MATNILVAENDPAAVEGLTQYSTRLGYPLVGLASSGTEAIRLAEELRPDLVLVNTRLDGGMGGLDVARAIDNRFRIPIVHLVARGDEQAVLCPRTFECFGCLFKPFDEWELRSAVELAVRRHAVESRLRVGEQRLAAALSNVDDAIIITDRDGTITFLNPAAERLTGRGRKEVSGRPVGQILRHPQETICGDVETPVERARPFGPKAAVDRKAVVDRNGTTVTAAATTAPIRDDRGRVIGGILAFPTSAPHERDGESLRLSEARLTEAQQIARLASWDIDLTTKQGVWSEEAFKQFGVQPGEVPATEDTFWNHVHPDDRGALREKVCRAVNTGTTFEEEFRIVWQDGTVRHIRARARASYDLDGRPLRFVGTSLDITDHKRVEGELEERARVADFVASIGVAMMKDRPIPDMLADCATELVRHFEAAFARVWTLAAGGEVLELQASAGQYTHLDGPHSRIPVGRFKIGQIAQSRKPVVTNDVQNDPRIGDRAWAVREGMVSFAGYPLVFRDQLVGVMALFARHPLSPATLEAMAFVANQVALGIERKRAELDLRSSERFANALFENSPIGIRVFDATGTLIRQNEAQVRMTHVPSRDCGVGRYNINRDPDATADAYRFTCAVAGEPVVDRCRPINQDRGPVDGCHERLPLWVDQFFVPIRDNKKETGSVAVFIHDVTEQVRAEDERRKIEAKLRHIDKLKSLGVLAGGIAHDFNNILTSVIGFTELALEQLTPSSEPHSHIQLVMREARRAAALTQQMLAYSGKGQFVFLPINLTQLVRDLDTLLHASVTKKALLRYRLSNNLPPIDGDAEQLRQVLLNLVTNASESLGGKGTITVATGVRDCGPSALSQCQVGDDPPPGLYVCLEVSDTGCGMTADTSAHVFDPFFSTKFTGRGLGLASVQGIVRGHRGAVRVESAVRQGSTFTVFLPVSGRQAEKASSIVEPTSWKGSGTVLVVDDEPAVRMLAQRILERLGFKVLTAADGREAVELYRAEADRIRVVLLDLTMPRSDGIEAFRELKQIQGDVRVILASGYGEEAADLAREKGVVAYVVKPFRIEEMVRALRLALRE